MNRANENKTENKYITNKNSLTKIKKKTKTYKKTLVNLNVHLMKINKKIEIYIQIYKSIKHHYIQREIKHKKMVK